VFYWGDNTHYGQSIPALRALRSQDYPYNIWAAAVCMNQSDIPERSANVQLMRLTYQLATCVVGHLGEE
jgi:Heterokaryon incompatibility protein (HET)